MLKNANTMEDFKEWDKAKLLEDAGRRIADDIASGAVLDQPERLLRFLLLTFADLKTHKYYYWFASPAFAFNPPPTAPPPQPLSAVLTKAAITALCDGHAALAATTASAHPPPFFAVRLDTSVAEAPLEVGPLKCFEEWRAAGGNGEALLAFCDPCPLANHPGWPLRNLLAFAASVIAKSGATDAPATVRVVCFREPPAGGAAVRRGGAEPGTEQAAPPSSIILTVTLPPAALAAFAPPPSEGDLAAAPRALPSVVGWEKNSNGKLGPRVMDLSAQMDPHALAEQSVDLNLRLMRWRLMPAFENETVAATRCLLFGAGTLGCAVSRLLLGYGVRHITLIDSGVVSFSNPVRQNLFEFTDCLEGGKPKAQAAAEMLRRIFPSATTEHHRISIPMPGHPVGAAEAERVRADCEVLSDLVARHDVVYLLTDTRESRWLPSLLACHHGKMAINAALGFDSLLVMRHGAYQPATPPPAAAAAAGADGASGGGACCGGTGTIGGGPRLGCYFCNDVVAPANSMLRRTLDQQCTVSRPGLSTLASSLAVELMVTLLHHPHGASAQADLPQPDASEAGEGGGGGGGGGSAARSPLGSVPHQLRMSLPMFRLDAMTGRAFDKCTACSETAVGAYRDGGFDFLLRAFNSATYLEDLTGLTQMHRDAEAALEAMALLDDDDDDDDDDE